jgi:hypothetical protein
MDKHEVYGFHSFWHTTSSSLATGTCGRKRSLDDILTTSSAPNLAYSQSDPILDLSPDASVVVTDEHNTGPTLGLTPTTGTIPVPEGVVAHDPLQTDHLLRSEGVYPAATHQTQLNTAVSASEGVSPKTPNVQPFPGAVSAFEGVSHTYIKCCISISTLCTYFSCTSI